MLAHGFGRWEVEGLDQRDSYSVLGWWRLGRLWGSLGHSCDLRRRREVVLRRRWRGSRGDASGWFDYLTDRRDSHMSVYRRRLGLDSALVVFKVR